MRDHDPTASSSAQRLRSALELPRDLVLPAYDGGSILNLPPTVGALLGHEGGWAAPPVAFLDELLSDGPTERVVLLVLDGLGAERLEAQRELERRSGGSDRLVELLTRFGGRVERLTSVSPATTSVATTCLLGNGASPAQSGMLGYTQRMPGLGVVANMLFWRPEYDASAATGSLSGWRVEPETFLPTPSVFQVLASGGVRGAAFLPQAIVRSPLSRMQLRGTTVHGVLNLIDTFAQLGAWLEATAGQRGFAYAYHPDFDALSHRDGPGNDRSGVRNATWGRLYDQVLDELEHLLDGLSAHARRRTRLLVTADHGLADTPRSKRRAIAALSSLRPLRSLREAGEARHVYLHASAGNREALRHEAIARLGDDFLVLDGEAALEAGLYGDPAAAHPEARHRLGDVVVLARGGASLWGGPEDVHLLGMHGALEATEMLVPLLCFRPDA